MIGGETVGIGGTAGGMGDLVPGGGDGSVETVAVAAQDVASSSPLKPEPALGMLRCLRIEPDQLPVPNGVDSDGSPKQPAPAPTSGMEINVPVDASDNSRLASYIPTAPLEPKPRALRLLLPAPAPTSGMEINVPVVASDNSRLASYIPTAPLEPKPRALRLLLPAPAFSPPAVAAPQSPARGNVHHSTDIPDNTSANPNEGGANPDAAMVLQWGHNKRSRARRDTTPAAPPPSPAQVHRRTVIKIKRHSSAPAEKLMPPTGTRSPNLRVTSSLPSHPAAAAAADALIGRGASLPRQRSAAVEERAGGQHQQAAEVVTTRLPMPRAAAVRGAAARKAAEAVLGTPESSKQKKGAHLEVPNKGDAAAFGSPSSSKHPPPPQAPPKLPMPRIVTMLTRKEKEEDWMAMTGTKLPQRPKEKRSKQAEKAVSSIYPGSWLSEVTRNKYVVRERKSRKEKQRGSGLKAMESSDSD